jgi:hypothetical protein
MRLLLKRGGRLESSAIDPRVIELQAAKEMLAEIFRVRAGEVEEMIWMRPGSGVIIPIGFHEFHFHL